MFPISETFWSYQQFDRPYCNCLDPHIRRGIHLGFASLMISMYHQDLTQSYHQQCNLKTLATHFTRYVIFTLHHTNWDLSTYNTQESNLSYCKLFSNGAIAGWRHGNYCNKEYYKIYTHVVNRRTNKHVQKFPNDYHQKIGKFILVLNLFRLSHVGL